MCVASDARKVGDVVWVCTQGVRLQYSRHLIHGPCSMGDVVHAVVSIVSGLALHQVAGLRQCGTSLLRSIKLAGVEHL